MITAINIVSHRTYKIKGTLAQARSAIYSLHPMAVEAGQWVFAEGDSYWTHHNRNDYYDASGNILGYGYKRKENW